MTQKLKKLKAKYVSNTGFDSKLAQAYVITKRNFDAKSIGVENNIKKLQTFDPSYFRGKIILMKMPHEIIEYLYQYSDILK